MIWFAANVLHEPLDPWQQWVAIHLGELLEDGRPRFRTVLVIVARQNGKTHLCKVLALFWMFVEKWPMIFGTSTNLEQAKEAWEAAKDLALQTQNLAADIPRGGVKIGNGQQVIKTVDRSQYKIGAADRRGGRGKSIDRAIGDELREQLTWDAYGAAHYAMNARPRAQAVYITNQGDARSIVLHSLRSSAIAGDDPRLGVFEYSAPEGSHPTDVHAMAAANPQFGRRMDPDSILGGARRVAKPGADPAELATYLTEVLCMAVRVLNPAFSAAAWVECRNPGPIPAGRRPAACLDVSPDLGHVALAVAVTLPNHQIRGEVVASWDTIAAARAALPALVAQIRPSVLGWFPSSPAAALNADLADRRKKGVMAWPPPGVRVAEIKAETAAVCMGFGSLVDARQFWHSGQELLDEHIGNSQKHTRPDQSWVIERMDDGGRVSAAYAMAGAVHLARTAPSRGAVRVVTPTRR